MRLKILGESSNETWPYEIKGNKRVEKQNLEKIPNKVKIKKDKNYYKKGSNVNWNINPRPVSPYLGLIRRM